jgi:hypothetical protein
MREGGGKVRVELELDVCNVCQDPRREVREFSFTAGREAAEKGHLCAEHMEGAVRALRAPERPRAPSVAPVKKATAKKAAKAGGRRSTRTKTLEEIEAEKAAAQA